MWCKSNADGWVYGHGSFAITLHKIPVFGCFMWISNSDSVAKRLWMEIFNVKEHIEYVAMGSKEDDFNLFRELKKQRKMNLITYYRQNMDRPPHRKKMIQFMKKQKHQKIYRQRDDRVELMQGTM